MPISTSTIPILLSHFVIAVQQDVKPVGFHGYGHPSPRSEVQKESSPCLRGGLYLPWSSRNLSASMAAAQPDPAAVMAWR